MPFDAFGVEYQLWHDNIIWLRGGFYGVERPSLGRRAGIPALMHWELIALPLSMIVRALCRELF